jgi:Flp pilus assembly protein TadG
VALLTGLLAVPLIGLGALAVDFGNVATTKISLDAAADSAALLATTAAANAYLAGSATPVATAQAAASARFTAQAGTMVDVSLGAVQVSVTQKGTIFTSSVTYNAAVTTTLARVLGITSIPVMGTSASSVSVNPYVDIQVLMDVSSSMTVGASTAAINQLNQLTAAYMPTGPLPSNAVPGEACGFACHWTTTGSDYYSLAESNGVQLRIDVLRSSVGNLVSSIAGLNNRSAFRVGLYTFGQVFNTIYALSGNIGGASSAVAQIVPDINSCSNDCPDTYFATAVSSLAAITGTSGNGTTQATSQKFLFIVTDGLVDENVGGNRVIETVQPTDCDPIKAKGITILVLYTPYLPLPTNYFYNDFVAPIQANIGPALQACASAPNYFYQADNASDINAQLQLMLGTVLQTSSHLTK